MNDFYFPANEGHPTELGGNNAAAFRDAPEVWAVMQYLGSPEFANARQTAQSSASPGGPRRPAFLRPTARRRPERVYSARAEASCRCCRPPTRRRSTPRTQMPTEVGSGTFWAEATSLVNGDRTRNRPPTTSRRPGRRVDDLSPVDRQRATGHTGGRRPASRSLLLPGTVRRGRHIRSSPNTGRCTCRHDPHAARTVLL